jgi:hypothetical protein
MNRNSVHTELDMTVENAMLICHQMAAKMNTALIIQTRVVMKAIATVDLYRRG